MASGYRQRAGSSDNRHGDRDDEKNEFKHDTDMILIHAKNATEAAKVMKKEKKNIKRKQRKTHSKELPRCIEKYYDSLQEIKDAWRYIGDLLEDKLSTEKKTENRQLSTQSFHGQTKGRKGLRQEEKPITEQQLQCLHCSKKDRKIKELEETLKSTGITERANEQNLQQVPRSNSELQQQYEYEVNKSNQFEDRYYKERKEKETALRSSAVKEKETQETLENVLRTNNELQQRYESELEKCKNLKDTFDKERKDKENVIRSFEIKEKEMQSNLETIRRSKNELQQRYDSEEKKRKQVEDKYHKEIQEKENVRRSFEIKEKEMQKNFEIKEKEMNENLEIALQSNTELDRRYQSELQTCKQLEDKHHKERKDMENVLRSFQIREEENQKNLQKVCRKNDELQQCYEAERNQRDRFKHMYQEEQAAKDDALRRLSSMASSKLRDNNPNITDLSDQNRPTKIAEKMSELYDNQWTDAFDALEEQTIEERQIVQILLDSLMDVYRECSRLASENFFERVQRSIEIPVEGNKMATSHVVLPDQLKQQVKEFRKSRAPAVVKEIKEVVKKRIKVANQELDEIQAYISSCIEIGWLAAVQDPPLVLNAQASAAFDTNAFKDYTRRGKYTEFVVWPTLYLHDGGAQLAKGVAQGCDHVQASNT